MAFEDCSPAFDAVFELDLDCVFDGGELAEEFYLTFWWQDPDVHPFNCCLVVFLVFDDCFCVVKLQAVCCCGSGEVVLQCGPVF